MTQQAPLEIETATAVRQLPRNEPPERREKEALGDIQAILVDAAVQVGALIGAACIHCFGDWVDWQHYRPHPRMAVGENEDEHAILRLTLTRDERGLHAGGYIEMRVLPEEKVIEADGGYYDAYHQPKSVIEGSIRWNETNQQRLGQVLLLMHDRIVREYMARARSEESLGASSRSLDRGGIAEMSCSE